jgi:uncharacterized protein YrrD
MIRAYELVGRPVITIDEGAVVGETAGVIIDTASANVAALIVNATNRFEAPKAVPYALVQGIGDDAVIIENASSMADFGTLPEILDVGRPDSDIRGVRAITRTGRLLGTVADLMIDLDAGSVVAYEIRGAVGGADATDAIDAASLSLLPVELVITVGRQALITAAETAAGGSAK